MADVAGNDIMYAAVKLQENLANVLADPVLLPDTGPIGTRVLLQGKERGYVGPGRAEAGWGAAVRVFWSEGAETFGNLFAARSGDNWQSHIAWGWPYRTPTDVKQIMAQKLKTVLEEKGLLLDPEGWVVGEGRTREEACANGALAASIWASLLKQKPLIEDIRAQEEKHRAQQELRSQQNRAQMERERQLRLNREIGELNVEIGEEALRLLQEGLLDGSNALAGLREVAVRLAALRGIEIAPKEEQDFGFKM